MSMLVECPNCGPREIAELRCAGEVTTPAEGHADRPRAERVHLLPRQRGRRPARMVVLPRLRGLVPRRAQHRHERGPEDVAACSGCAGAGWEPRREAPPRPNERIDRSREVTFTFDGSAVTGFHGRHDRLGALRLRPAPLLAQLQVPPAARSPVLLGSLRELPDDGRRDPERPRLHGADPRGRGRQAARTSSARSTAT